MTMREVVTVVEGNFFCLEEQAEREIVSACGADSLSDVAAFIKDRALLLTGLVNPQVIRTAGMLEIPAILFVRGKTPNKEMIELAAKSGVILAGTRLPMFLACGTLYASGLRPDEPASVDAA